MAKNKSNKEDKLSERQQKMLAFIEEYIKDRRRPPTIREIGEAAGISSTSVVNYNLLKLVDKGLITRDSEVSRGLSLTQKALKRLGSLDLLGGVESAVSNLVRIPLVGDIVASEPLEVGNDTFSAYDEEDGIDLSVSLLPDKTDDLFALRVNGDSMIDAMVRHGDIVVMKQQAEARNGDMVAVWLTPDDTTTLKYFYNESGRVRLQPANPTMDPIYVNPSNVRVQGKVVMVVRQTT